MVGNLLALSIWGNGTENSALMLSFTVAVPFRVRYSPGSTTWTPHVTVQTPDAKS